MKETKVLILKATSTVLIREGSANFSIRKVAKEAELSLSNLQYHFPTRIDLLSELLKAIVKKYQLFYEDLLRNKNDVYGKEVLHQFILSSLNGEIYQEDIAVFRALYSFTDPEVIKIIDCHYHEIHDKMVEILSKLKGIPKEPQNVQKAVSILFPYLDGFDTSSHILKNGYKEISGILTKIIWNILKYG